MRTDEVRFKSENDTGVFGIVLPDKLKHEQLVEIGVEQGSRDRVQCPVVVMRPLREVHDHGSEYSLFSAIRPNIVSGTINAIAPLHFPGRQPPD